MAEGKASERKLTALERESRALDLKAAGLNYDSIAERLGFANRSGAYKAVMRALTIRVTERDEKAAELRELTLERLERLVAGITPAALGGVRKVPYEEETPVMSDEGPVMEVKQRVADVYVPPDNEAARVLLKALHQQAGLLGLYPPRGVEISGAGGGPIQLENVEGSPKERLLDKVDELTARRQAKKRPARPAKKAGASPGTPAV